jgi:C-terminal processing protease CtpA/Prc
MKHRFGKPIKRVLLVFVAAGCLQANATAPRPYFAQVVFEQLETVYVNPTGLDMTKTLERLKSVVDTRCQNGCEPTEVEPILAQEVTKLGDKHLNYHQTYAPKGFDDTLPKENRPIGNLLGILVRELNGQVVVVGINPVSEQKFSLGDVIVSVNNNEIQNLEDFDKLERNANFFRIQVQSKQKKFWVSVFLNDQIWQNQSTMVGNVLHLRLNTVRTDVDDLYVHAQIRKALEGNVDGVVLDLRDCYAGGRTFGAVNVAAAFLKQIGVRRRDSKGNIVDYSYDKGQLFYYEQAVNFRDSKPFPEPALWNKKLVVLTSKYTYSACENVASYLQKYSRAKIIGEPSVGGGGVTVTMVFPSIQYGLTLPRQRQFHLPDDQPQVLQVIPDQILPFDVQAALEFGRDVQLEVALEHLKN